MKKSSFFLSCCLVLLPFVLPARTIVLKSGVTYLDRPMVLTADDSGTVLEGAADGSSVLSGAIPVTGLRFTPADGGVFVAEWKAPTPPDQLFVDGKKYWMARYPNRDPGAGRNVYDVWRLGEGRRGEKDAYGRVAGWKNPSGAYLHAMHRHLWGDMHWRILGVGTDGKLKLEGGWQNNRPTPPHDVYRYVENVREELDQPGEWYYDAAAGRLYVMPFAGTDLSRATIEVVRFANLLTLTGTAEKPVRNVTVRNVTFRQAARTFMENRERLLRSDWTLCRQAAVVFSGTENCTLENCRFEELGGNAFIFDGYNARSAVTDSSFREIGASGVLAVGRLDAVREPLVDYGARHDYAKIDRTPGPKSENYPRDCRIENCSFRRTGREEKQTAGVSIDIASRIVVRSCTVREVPRAGINIGDGCFGGHLIEKCDIRDTVLETGDHGAFNSWGRDRYWMAPLEPMDELMAKDPALVRADCRAVTTLRDNVWQCAHGWDIDLDDGSSFYNLENNVCLQGGIKLREGFRRTVRGNRCVNNGLHAHCWLKTGGDLVEDNDFDKGVSFAGRSTYCRPDMSLNVVREKQAALRVERKTVDGMVWRKFDGKAEYSAYGVTPDLKGWVLERGAKQPFADNDLLVRETLEPLKGTLEIYRNQQRLTLSLPQ